MNVLSLQLKTQIIQLLVEGNSMRSVERIVGCSINTITKLLCDVGAACAAYQDQAMRNLPCKRIQCDEIWSFVYAKERVTPAMEAGIASHVWSIEDIARLIPVPVAKKRGSYKKKIISN